MARHSRSCPPRSSSIWAGNQEVTCSLPSRTETFEHGFLEAVCLLARSRGRPVLFVTGELGGSILGRHLRPVPRFAEARRARELGGVRAMMDITDGPWVAARAKGAKMVQIGALIADLKDRSHEKRFLLPETEDALQFLPGSVGLNLSFSPK